ncbi:hypothetical protein [Flavobacterium sp.]|uniref:hypothetical protein n=1 Tax=Flavobacterium sp. TaxID=239 RepID=UPI003751E6C0
MYFSITMKYILYLLVFLASNFSFSQNDKLKLTKIDSISIEADAFIGYDGFGNYFYTKNNVIYKKAGTSSVQYQNLSLGKITKVDILNPLKVIVFYEGFNSVIVLDNQLNEIQKVDFSSLETPVVASAIGISGQNKLWVFNTLNQQIGLYDLNTATYQNLGMPIRDGISYYQTDFNYFQWIDKQNQWNICTIYGRIFQNGKVENATNLQLLPENKVLFIDKEKLYLRDRNIDKRYQIEIVEKSFKKIYYKDQILSIFTDKGITNYKIILP